MTQNGYLNQTTKKKSKKMSSKKSRKSLMASKRCKEMLAKKKFSKMKEENFKLTTPRKKKWLKLVT